MSRFARGRRVFFLEEPLFEAAQPHLRSFVCPKTGVRVQTPILPAGLSSAQILRQQQLLLASLLAEYQITDCIAWYYTPMAKQFASDLHPSVTVYDCMDELSAFAGAPPAMQTNEQILFRDADLVFTGGMSLFESKRKQHSSAHLFPSSVDGLHFLKARTFTCDPPDQARLPRPRLGYAGVIDERMDLDLLRYVAAERPSWQLILLGPVVKIDAAMLPQAANIHYLGMKKYEELPAYFSGWDVGMLPFALNPSTRFISPTKTPEYLAAGLRVISTPLHDVVTPYGDLGLVGIANNPGEFVKTAESFLQTPSDMAFRERADRLLSQSSWDKTWSDMNQLIDSALALKYFSPANPLQSPPATKAAQEGAANV